MEELLNKKIAVLGLGMEGRDVVRYLQLQGMSISVHDAKNWEDLDLTNLDTSRITFHCGENYLDNLGDYDIIFRSPGVYRYKPELIAAEEKGAVITSQIQFFFDLAPAKIIGVTGTKGKGTTSTLIYQILKSANYDVYLAGNIGKPCLELLPLLNENSWVVLELSSFQLIDMNKSPHIGVVLNITLDHMDWHVSQEEYINAKKAIIAHQSDSDFAVINFDYQNPKSFENLGSGKKYYFSRNKAVSGAFVRDQQIILNVDSEEIVGDTEQLLLRGEHNWENITASITAAKLAGASTDSIKQTVFEFKGLEHRLELSGEYNGIKFYNDSFATGPQPTIAAIEAFNEPETIIIGGYDKGLDYTEMLDLISSRENINKVLLIGNVGEKLKSEFEKRNLQDKFEYLGTASMSDIVKKAFEVTPAGGVVILSPGAASFDMFKDYKDRGNQFKSAVQSLEKQL